MARPGVTYFDVANVASLLIEDGSLPTIDKVRHKLGTGSNSTIAAHLKQWKAENMPTTSQVPITTLPASLVSQLQALWDNVKNEARKEVDEIQNKLKQQLLINEQGSNQIISLTSLNEEQTQKIENLSKELDQKSNELNQLDNKIHLLEEKLNSQSHRLVDKDKTIEDLKTQLSNLHANFEHFQKSSLEQRQKDNLEYAASINIKEQDIHKLRSLIESEKNRNQSLAIELEQAKSESKHSLLENHKSNNKIKELKQTNLELQTQISSYLELIHELKTQIEQLEQKNIVQNSTNHEQASQLSYHKAQLTSLNQQLDKQDEKMELINQKNFDLVEQNTMLKSKIVLLESKLTSKSTAL